MLLVNTYIDSIQKKFTDITYNFIYFRNNKLYKSKKEILKTKQRYLWLLRLIVVSLVSFVLLGAINLFIYTPGVYEVYDYYGLIFSCALFFIPPTLYATNGLLNKMLEFKAIIQLKEYEIITETLIINDREKPKIPDTEYFVEYYSPSFTVTDYNRDKKIFVIEMQDGEKEIITYNMMYLLILERIYLIDSAAKNSTLTAFRNTKKYKDFLSEIINK